MEVFLGGTGSSYSYIKAAVTLKLLHVNVIVLVYI